VTDQEPLDFERAEYDADAPKDLTCAFCGQPVPDYYYQVAGKLACKRCQPRIAAELTRSPRLGRALLFGLLAAAAGSAIWYGIIAATGYEVGLIAIVVGFMVGSAVRKGSGGVGGPSLQLLAMFLTYSSIVFAYLPLFLKEFKSMAQQQGATGGVTTADIVAAGAEPVGVVPVTELTASGARGFLAALDLALDAWTDSAARAGRDPALERTWAALQTLLASDPAPAFGFGDSGVSYHGAPLEAAGAWAWSSRLAEAGYPRLAFDTSVTRLDLVGLLDGIAAAAGTGASPGVMGAALAIAVLLAFLYLAPFLAGLENVIGVLIIGFAVWEAWRLNKRVKLEIMGPFEVKQAGPAPA
jgi:hypothetical protein